MAHGYYWTLSKHKKFLGKENFLEVQALGEDLAWKVIKLWMESEGRDLNNYQWRVVANAISECSLPIFLKLVSIYRGK